MATPLGIDPVSDVLLLWLSWVKSAVIVEESPEIIGDVALIFNTIHGS